MLFRLTFRIQDVPKPSQTWLGGWMSFGCFPQAKANLSALLYVVLATIL